MALTPKLEIRQSQSLLMTPQLRQAINLLQLSNIELNELVEQELNNNPLLEREEDKLLATDDNFPLTIDDFNNQGNADGENEEFTPDIEYDNQFDDSGSDCEGYNQDTSFDWSDYNQHKSNLDTNDFDYFEKKLSGQPSLFQIIEEQINLRFQSNRDKIIARLLSEQLDDAGYFRGNIALLAATLNTEPQKIEIILNQLKGFEPSGIFSQNLAECLAIQLRDRNRFDPAMECLLNHLELLGNRQYKELKKICNVTDEDLASMIDDIKALNPKPAASYHQDNIAYIIPDVYVRRLKDGSYHIELNTLSLPRLLINHQYVSEIKNQSASSKEAKRYLKENLNHASFLMKALHQRATTILRVSEEIVKQQRDFFENGLDYLKPMTLKDIAYNLEMHESTVSRVTNRKYMQTPRGLFELKYFFSQAAGTYTGNEETSTLTIKHRIKQLISEEDSSNILSDDKLVELLAREGIKIARRTVAKYREAQNIPTSAQRKRQKRNSF